jgi:hypothetical protein
MRRLLLHWKIYAAAGYTVIDIFSFVKGSGARGFAIPLFAAVILAALSQAEPSGAQEIDPVIKPLMPATKDVNGVDIVTGSVFFEHSISIPWLNRADPVFTLIHKSSGYDELSWSHTLSGQAGCLLNPDEWELYGKILVSAGGISEIIDITTESISSDVPLPPHPQAYYSTVPATNDGGAISIGSIGQVVWRRRDGSIITYATTWDGDTGCYIGNGIDNIKRPDGEILQYMFGPGSPSQRTLMTVSSNLGYQIRLTFRPYVNLMPCMAEPRHYYQFGGSSEFGPCLASVTVVNTSVDNCDPVGPCSYSRVWPSLTVTNINQNSIQVSDESGRKTTYVMSVDANSPAGFRRRVITSVNYPDGRQRIISYKKARSTYSSNMNTTGVVASVVEAGSTWIYNWSSNILPVENRDTFNAFVSGERSITDPTGRTTLYQVDGRWRVDFGVGQSYLTKVTDPDGNITSYTWYGYHRPVLKSVTLPSGAVQNYSYDNRRNIERLLMSEPGGQTIEVSSGFDEVCSNFLTCNKPNWTRSANGQQTDYTYDPAHGGVLTVLEPASGAGSYGNVRRLTSYEYDAGGIGVFRPVRTRTCTTAQTCAGSANEVVTETFYDAQRRPIRTATRAGDWTPTTASSADQRASVSNMTHTALGDVASIDGPLPGSEDTVYYYYNDARELVVKVSPDPDGSGPLPRPVERYVYDGGGRQIRIETGTANTIDASDFVLSRFKRMTYEPASGLLIKTEEVVP